MCFFTFNRLVISMLICVYGCKAEAALKGRIILSVRITLNVVLLWQAQSAGLTRMSKDNASVCQCLEWKQMSCCNTSEYKMQAPDSGLVKEVVWQRVKFQVIQAQYFRNSRKLAAFFSVELMEPQSQNVQEISVLLAWQSFRNNLIAHPLALGFWRLN